MMDVNTGAESQTPVHADVISEEPTEVIHEDVTTTVPGSKTDPNLLLKSLQEERAENKRLKEELELKSSVPSIDDVDVESDEGRQLKKLIAETNTRIAQLEREKQFDRVLAENPLIKENKAEFETFLDDDENKRLSLSRAAKLFLTEKGLVGDSPRKGLEKATGGDRVPQTGKMTLEEVKELRETNYRKYSDMVKAGQIQFD